MQVQYVAKAFIAIPTHTHTRTHTHTHKHRLSTGVLHGRPGGRGPPKILVGCATMQLAHPIIGLHVR